jgi:hypothetical protein
MSVTKNPINRCQAIYVTDGTLPLHVDHDPCVGRGVHLFARSHLADDQFDFQKDSFSAKNLELTESTTKETELMTLDL